MATCQQTHEAGCLKAPPPTNLSCDDGQTAPVRASELEVGAELRAARDAECRPDSAATFSAGGPSTREGKHAALAASRLLSLRLL